MVAAVSAESALQNLPAGLRRELLDAYNAVLRNYRERRWEPSELNGGKLCEVVYTILRGHVDGRFPARATKPRNMADACKALELADVDQFPRSIRIQIPRMLVALYEIRNNRGVGHVGGDVNPNVLDATGVLAMSKWVVAELVRVFHGVSTADAEAVVEGLVERTMPLVWVVGAVTRILDSKMGAREKALVLLYHANSWVDDGTLRQSIEYGNVSMFRKLLTKCHKDKLVEYDRAAGRLMLSPKGIDYVETSLLSQQA